MASPLALFGRRIGGAVRTPLSTPSTQPSSTPVISPPSSSSSTTGSQSNASIVTSSPHPFALCPNNLAIDEPNQKFPIDFCVFQSPVLKPVDQWTEENSSPCGVRYFPLSHREHAWSLSPSSEPQGSRYDSPSFSSPSSRVFAAAFSVGVLASQLEDDLPDQPVPSTASIPKFTSGYQDMQSAPPKKHSSGYQDMRSSPPKKQSSGYQDSASPPLCRVAKSPSRGFDINALNIGPYLGLPDEQEFFSPLASLPPHSPPDPDAGHSLIEPDTFYAHTTPIKSSPSLSSSSSSSSNSRKRQIFEKALIDFSSLSLVSNSSSSTAPSPQQNVYRSLHSEFSSEVSQTPSKYRRAPRRSPLSSPSFDWNREYQRILRKPLLKRGALLSQLTSHFEKRARMIGEIIIRERNYPNSRKSIPPLQLGHCGGIKYRKDGIFFKFATDHDQLLGGDMNAMKVAGHELKGLTAFSSCGMLFGISFGLMALIDYRGYRLIATSELPISCSTIVYGSADGGNTVHSHDPEINAVIERVAKILNLKGHLCGLNPGQRGLIHGPCDLEGHIGTDGRFYILDLARVFPPQTPDPSSKGSFLYQLLRPELVAKSSTPLSSDAFSPFGACDPDAPAHDQDVRMATHWLVSEVIPEFAMHLASRSPMTLELSSLGRLVKQVHRAGINIRFLGQVRQSLLDIRDAPELSTLIMSELTARTLKHLLRSLMRKLESDDEEKFQLLVVNFFNQFLTPLFPLHDDSWLKTPYHLHIWQHAVFPLMHKLFPHSIDEIPDVSILARLIDVNLVFQRVQQLTGARFKDFDHIDSSDLPLTQSDLDGIGVLIRPMYAVPRIEADGLVECGRHQSGDERRDYLTLASIKYAQVLELKPDDYVVLTNLGAVLIDLARDLAQSGQVAESQNVFVDAFHKFSTALSLNRHECQTLSMWGNGLYIQAASLTRAFPSLSDSHVRSKVDWLLSESCHKYQQALDINADFVPLRFNFGSLLLKHTQLLLSFPIIPQSELPHRCIQLLDEADSHLSFASTKQPQDHDILVNQATLFLLRTKVNPDSPLNSSSLDSARSLFSRAESLQPGSARRC